MTTRWKSVVCVLFLVLGLCEVAAAEGLPVNDTFESYNTGSIDGEAGGTGWGASWQGSAGQSLIDTSGDPLIFQASNGLSIRSQTTLALTQNNSRIVSRALNGTFTGESLFMSMLVRFEGTPGDNDFLGFWVQNPGFGDSPQFGIKSNEGGGGTRDLFVRLGTNARYSTEFVPGQTYLLVAEFAKNSAGYFNQGRLWVDPQCTDTPPAASAVITETPSNRVSQISELGIRTENIGGGQQVQVGQVAAGEQWSDVVQCRCYQNGLEATFHNNYNNRNDLFPTTTPDLTRLDPQVDFDWNNGSPDPVINNDDFAVQWQGTIEVPETGNYRFRARTDDGVRLWVDDLSNALIDDWRDRAAANSTSDQIMLEAGRRYAIRMQFYENGGQASSRLSWQRPGQGSFVVIPEANLFACLPVQAPKLQSAQALCGASDMVQVKFAQSGSDRELDAAAAENTDFYNLVSVDSGAQIDVSAATLEADGYSVLLELDTEIQSGESYRLTVTDIQDVGGLVMDPNPSSIEFAAAATGLRTSYWNNRFLDGEPDEQQISAQVNSNWGNGSPIPGTIQNDQFSVRWTGFILPPSTGDYRFRTRTDDGARLWIDDLSTPIIDRWRNQSPTNHDSGVIRLQQGQLYAIRMEMYENRGGATAQLFWNTPGGGGFGIVPASAFFSCPEQVTTTDHFRISHSGFAVTCSPTPVTFQATDASGAPVADYTGSLNISTSTSRGDWSANGTSQGVLSPGAGNSGAAIYSFVEADNGVVALNLSHTSVATVDIDASDGTVGESTAFDPEIVFEESGFVFHQASGFNDPITSLVAGRNSTAGPGAQNLRLTAVRTSDTSGACEAFLTGNESVDIGYACDSPASCASSDALTLNGQSIPSNDSGGSGNTAAITLDFGDSTTSSASIALSYADAGRISLFARKTLLDAAGASTGEDIAGSSNAFVSVPAGFCIDVPVSASACNGDPAVCSVFTAAGADFNTTYRAVAWQTSGESGDQFCSGNVTTPGFERSGLEITHSLEAPAGGAPGDLGSPGAGSPQVNFTTGGQGQVAQLQSISEVGVFRLRIPAGQSYLGESLSEGESANIGRLRPDSFSVEQTDPGEIAPYCMSSSSFLYTGKSTGWEVEPELRISALNTLGDVTTNYTLGSFLKLVAADVLRTMPTTDSTETELGSANLMPLQFTDSPGTLEPLAGYPGEMRYRFSSDDTLEYPKQAVSRVSPFTPTLTFSITAVEDSDTVNADAVMPISFSPDVNLQLRYGRLVMSNIYGPENVASLPMPFAIEHLDGGRFVPNTDDSCTGWNTGNITNSENYHSLTAGAGDFSAGDAAPLELVPNGNDGTDKLSWAVPVWLQDYWNASATLENPSALATFGVYRGHDRVIYWREK